MNMASKIVPHSVAYCTDMPTWISTLINVVRMRLASLFPMYLKHENQPGKPLLHISHDVSGRWDSEPSFHLGALGFVSSIALHTS
jgi:hypothetical protein